MKELPSLKSRTDLSTLLSLLNLQENSIKMGAKNLKYLVIGDENKITANGQIICDGMATALSQPGTKAKLIF